jgi:hypothetical protein
MGRIAHTLAALATAGEDRLAEVRAVGIAALRLRMDATPPVMALPTRLAGLRSAQEGCETTPEEAGEHPAAIHWIGEGSGESIEALGIHGRPPLASLIVEPDHALGPLPMERRRAALRL